ncbi:hypothetical protein G7078_05925 [Sphingomonas sinipercae]|uniref:Uncharacterized protein n=1 Tax=Sphingomonas sinipercae TaxID=2714944 RepID=A0A6G7ZN57_9SPHN|nr:hypothetical protein [Sphingomonas sinipercae]QIL02373.1 hypothetical protein G7078_05925 [Sphingomonas sinipercae]
MIDGIADELKNPTRPASVDVDLRSIAVSGAATTALADMYAHWEGGRGPRMVSSLTATVARKEVYGEQAASAVSEAIDLGLARIIGPGRKSGEYVQLTPLGIAWFEENCDYWRAGNIYRYKSRFGAIGCFQFDPRLPWTSRIRDPFVALAAVLGAVVGLLFARLAF